MVEAVLHRNLSLTSHHQADFTAALEHAEESLRLEPQNVKSKYRRGLALWALDRSEEARKDLKARRWLGVKKQKKTIEAEKDISYSYIFISIFTESIRVEVTHGDPSQFCFP